MGLDGKVVYYVLCGARKARYAADNIRELKERGCRVYVLMTPAAEAIISPDELRARCDVVVRNSFVKQSADESLPLEDMVVVAPATYNTINKIAHGISDNFATACSAAALGRSTPIYLAPAVNFDLWSSPILQNSLKRLREYGVKVIHPDLDASVQTCTMADAGKILDTVYGDWDRLHYKGIYLDGSEWDALYRRALDEHAEALCETAHQLEKKGLTSGQAGCISQRLEGDALLISATRTCLGSLRPDELVLVAGGDETTGEVRWYGPQCPSSETPLHLALYARRPDIGAVIHSHCPAVTYSPRMKPWRSVQYIRASTFEFGEQVADHLDSSCKQFLIAKDHGEVAVGRTLDEALSVLESALEYASGRSESLVPPPVLS